MKVRVKNENRDCNRIHFVLESVELNFASAFMHKPLTEKDVLEDNLCKIEFTDSFEIEAMIKMLERMKNECQMLNGGIWHRV